MSGADDPPAPAPARAAGASRVGARELTLGELLRRRAWAEPDRAALRLDARTTTYGELHGRADRLAQALREREVGPGDRVGVWMTNGVEMVETLFAIHKLGAAAVPLNVRLAPAEVAFIAQDAGVRGLIADQALLAGGGAGIEGPWQLGMSGDRDSPYEQAIAQAGGPLEATVVADGAAAFVMYTSGTTGFPKGAVLTHKNLVTNTWNWTLEVGIGREDVYTSGFPLFHIGGLVGLYPFLMLGGCVVLQRTGGFDPEAALHLMDQAATTVCAYVPAQWQLLVGCSGAKRRLRGQRRALWGGSPASRPLLESMVRTLPEGSVISTFGQTEVTANATFLGPADALRKLGSVGRPALTVEHRIVDGADRDVPRGEVGEIVYRGPTVMLEYLNRPDATEDAFRGGWFHGGDLVREDEEGYLYVVDRKHDMIISGGENIYPAEVERVLVEHPAVAEVAVIGAAHPAWGETPIAYVVVSPGATAAPEELIAFCGERLARFKRPTRVIYIGELPRNASGKVLKRELRERASATGAGA